jgi:hypothetical protein
VNYTPNIIILSDGKFSPKLLSPPGKGVLLSRRGMESPPAEGVKAAYLDSMG